MKLIQQKSNSFIFIILFLLLSYLVKVGLTARSETCSTDKCDDFICNIGEDCFYTVCTEKTGTIKCNNRGVINIKRFWFGRNGTVICPANPIMQPNCINETLHEQQNINGKRMCDNETSCTFKAYYDERDQCGNPLWHDPCEATPKYIEATFTCIKKEPHNYLGDWAPWGKCNSHRYQYRSRNCTDPPNKECTKSLCKHKYPDSDTDRNFNQKQKCPKQKETTTIKTASLKTSVTITQTPSYSASQITPSSTRYISISIPPVITTKTPTTESPPSPDFYAKIKLTLVWEDFCKYSKEFRENIALLLSEKIKVKQNYEQVIIINQYECTMDNKDNAAVTFYVVTKSTKEPSANLTWTVVEEIEKLILNGTTGKLGPKFEGKITSIIFVKVPVEDGNDIPVWVIILIVFAILLFIVWILLTCYYFNHKRKKPQRVKYVLQPIEVTSTIKKSDENKNEDIQPPFENEYEEDKPTFKSAVSVTVRPKSLSKGDVNPTYEMDECGRDGTFQMKPVNVKLVSVTAKGEDDDNSKKTEMYVDGKRQSIKV